MAYSDNLYSAGDSDIDGDAESFTDELSPTDGYFVANSIPNTVVADPTPDLDRKTTEDKVLIPGPRGHRTGRDAGGSSRDPAGASTLEQLYPSNMNTHAAPQTADETPATPFTMYNTNTPISPLRNTTPFSPRSGTPASPRSSLRGSNLRSEHRSSVGVPPPAYTPSATSTSPLRSQQRSYNTFEPNRYEQNNSPAHPVSMGRPSISREEERLPLFKPPPKRSCIPAYLRITRETVRKLLFAALVFVVLSTIMASILNATLADKHRSGSPEVGDSHCSYATFHQAQEIFGFDVGTGRDLSVRQTTHNNPESGHSYERVSTKGEISVRRVRKAPITSPYFLIDIYTSDPSLQVVRSWDDNSRILQLSTPEHSNSKLPGPHCISVEIILYLPEDAELGVLNVESITLNQNVDDNLKITASNSRFKTTSGNVRFPVFQESRDLTPTKDELSNQTTPSFSKPNYDFTCRHIEVETISGNIAGLFPLYDYLGVKSTSGTVNVGVVPHEAAPGASSVPAELKIQTTSGNIRAHLPVVAVQSQRYLPPLRHYTTHVESRSGTIRGEYYQGQHGYYETVSGDIVTSILPVIGTSSGNTFGTHSQSGKQSLDVMQPIFFAQGGSSPSTPETPQAPHKPSNSPYIPIGDKDPYLLDPYLLPHRRLGPLSTRAISDTPMLRSLQSTHQSTSGNLFVKYPREWEGNLLMKLVSGKMDVDGEGLKVISSNIGFAKKELYVRKGVDKAGEGSSVDMSSISGSLTFRV